MNPEADIESPAIGDYAAIGDCRTAALVSRDGSVGWLCLPHFSGPSVFCALVDSERGGRFVISPSGPFESRRRYLGESNVLQSEFVTGTGVVRVTDCFPVASEGDQRSRLQPQRELLRVVEGVEGDVEIDILYQPRPDFARAPVRLVPRAALGWSCEVGTEVLFLHTDFTMHASAEAGTLSRRLRVTQGKRYRLSLTYESRGMGIILPLGDEADRRLETTCEWWQAWAGSCRYQGPYRGAVLRSALALKLCTFHLSGAVVAAPTASLPEAVGGGRNWDYRFCWLRDAALTVAAFHSLGFHQEGAAFVEWLLHATALSQPALQVVYDVYGRTDLHEEELDHLDGYRGSRPVRIGNGASEQRQLDIYGAVVLAVNRHIESGGRLGPREARFVVGLGRHICRHWRLPDQSIWEIRGDERHYTYSAFMSWLALDCLLMLDEQGLLRVPRERFRRERDAIKEAIEARGFNEQLGCYVDVLDGREVDASLLLMASYGYHGADHPRVLATYERISEELGRNGLLMRYRHGYDGLSSREGAFGLCSFWAVENLAKQGRLSEAHELFETLLGYANDVGLYAEEIDMDTGEPLGNFPQAFTHVGLINAAVALEETGAARGAA